jgi:NADH dehydrogenase/NADH:ubiquinone oxidoreductase subunit G
MHSEVYGYYEKLLRVTVLGKQFEMPENNTILRGLQFAVPQMIPLGRFCWNGDCRTCLVTVRCGAEDSLALACQVDVRDGMFVTSVSPEIQRLL